MKKILIALCALLAFGSAASADSFVERHFGYTYTTLGDYSGSGIAFGTKVMIPTTLLGGIEVGGGFNGEVSFIDMTIDNDDSSVVYGADLDLYTGYTIKDFTIRAGVGYQLTAISNIAYTHGVLYTGEIGYHINDKVGVNLAYKGGTMSFETDAGSGPDIDQSQIVASITWDFN